ncbi:MAG: hypothetical protein FWG18_01510 [Alphaproteobacteria bacterium]|nr:hypothetical protein [Alphaproteobacteria bacterium]
MQFTEADILNAGKASFLKKMKEVEMAANLADCDEARYAEILKYLLRLATLRKTYLDQRLLNKNRMKESSVKLYQQEREKLSDKIGEIGKILGIDVKKNFIESAAKIKFKQLTTIEKPVVHKRVK